MLTFEHKWKYKKATASENKNTFIDQAMKINNSCTEGGFFLTVGEQNKAGITGK